MRWSKNVTHLLIDISVLFIQWCWQVLIWCLLFCFLNTMYVENAGTAQCAPGSWTTWPVRTNATIGRHCATLSDSKLFEYGQRWIGLGLCSLGPHETESQDIGQRGIYGILPMTPLQTSMLCLHSLVHCITDLQLCKVILDTTLTFEQISLNYLWLADIFSNFR